MTGFTNDKASRPIVRSSLIAFVMFAGTASMPASAETQEIRIDSDQSPAEVRRAIASAARALCNLPSVASIYRDGARRCREQVIADAERQLERRTRLTAAVR